MKKIRAVAVASFLLRLTEASGRRAVENSVEQLKKFFSNLTEMFRVDLKTILGIIRPTLSCCEEKSQQVFGLYCIMDRPYTFDVPTIQYYCTV